jgi:hypothetical protein
MLFLNRGSIPVFERLPIQTTGLNSAFFESESWNIGWIEQMFQRKGATYVAFPRDRITGWLSWLAGKMRENSQWIFLVEGFQPTWLGTKIKQAVYQTLVFLIGGMTFGLIGGLFYGPHGDLRAKHRMELLASPG